MEKILVIEDNDELGILIRDFLRKEEYDVELVTTAEAGLKSLEAARVDLVLLDVMLPGMDGFDMCTRIRSAGNIPVLMMSARTDDGSKLKGYDCGADDYIEKPFSIPVLVAKIKALIKRSGITVSSDIIEYGDITLDKSGRQVRKNGELVQLGVKEFDVLQYLMEHKGQAVNKETLFNVVWGDDCFSEFTTLNVHIRWLREKLEEDPGNPSLIQTVWRVGYKFGENI